MSEPVVQRLREASTERSECGGEPVSTPSRSVDRAQRECGEQAAGGLRHRRGAGRRRHRLHPAVPPAAVNAFFLARTATAAPGPPDARGPGAFTTIYLTGRPERNALTTAWLAAPACPPDPLHMRPDDDFRPARWVKPTPASAGPPATPRCSTVGGRSRCCPPTVAGTAATWLPHSSTLQSAQKQGRT